MATNRQVVAAVDFVTVSGYDKLVAGQTREGGGTLDLLMTDVAGTSCNRARVAVVELLDNSYHSSCQWSFRWRRPFQIFCVSRIFF